MKILEQHWDEEANNLNDTKFHRSNITLDLATTSFPAKKTDYSNLKIPLICVGGVTALIILVSIVFKFSVCKNSGNPTGPINLNINNSANNENKTATTATSDVKDTPPVQETNQMEKPIEEILNMKPGDRSDEERRRVRAHRCMLKEQEATNQQPESEEPVKIWKLLAKDASLRTSSEQLRVDEHNRNIDPFQA